MSVIKKLDTVIANKIAAGEVIEKIANVVKELVENSIDAKAKKIDIELQESGLKSITVTDDGIGMDATDAVLAFERHATSKIKNINDLFRISSLGFRGEALPSIASVSRVEMITCDGEEGQKIIYEDGRFIKKETASSNQGTKITVTKLFYTTPARFKYLKSPQYELAMIVNLVNKFALGNPDISFKLTNNQKLQFVSPGNNQVQDIIANIYDKDIARNLLSFDAKSRDYTIHGYTSKPMINRSSNNYMHIFVNQRPISDTGIINVIRDCYEQLIIKGRYPITVLYIECDPSIVDVNIHPRKQEIKFSEYQKLLELIGKAISDLITDKPIYQTPTTEKVEKIKFEFHETPKEYESLDFEPVKEEKEIETFETILETEEPEPKKIPDLEYIGQYSGTYLLFQNEQGLYLVDQHAAAERIRYESYLLAMSERHQESQELLLPLELVLGKDLILQLESRLDKLEEFGIKGIVKDNVFLLEIVPAWFYKGLELVYAEETIQKLLENKDLDNKEIIDDLAKLLACKHSLKANHHVSQKEAEILIENLRKCKRPYTCPHGRPIMVHLDVQQIERWFNRVV